MTIREEPHNARLFTGLLSGGCDGRIKLWSLNTCSECSGAGVVEADDLVRSTTVSTTLHASTLQMLGQFCVTLPPPAPFCAPNLPPPLPSPWLQVPGLLVQCPRCDGRQHVCVSSFNVKLVSIFGGKCAVTAVTVVGSDAFVGTSSRCGRDAWRVARDA